MVKIKKKKNVRETSLGALDLLEGLQIFPDFDTGDQQLVGIRGVKSNTNTTIKIPDNEFDLVIMNPPFTRPTNHEGKMAQIPIPSFAGFEKSVEEQKAMSKKLSKIKYDTMVGNGTAGLASYFIDIAHRKVKSPNGIIAMVLPASFLIGSSWKSARDLLIKNYTDILIFRIASAGTFDRAFSADTKMAEILIIGTRSENMKPSKVRFVNLLHRPNSILEAVFMARKVQKFSDSNSLLIGETNVIANIVYSEIENGGYAGVINKEVATIVHKMQDGELRLPRESKSHSLPITKLKKTRTSWIIASSYTRKG